MVELALVMMWQLKTSLIKVSKDRGVPYKGPIVPVLLTERIGDVQPEGSKSGCVSRKGSSETTSDLLGQEGDRVQEVSAVALGKMQQS
ncbi:hypothetical protein Y1Q_0002440 [Alligator mississippiensis]|uniref:Uncharacterized protein n=1 Tax=Alligator mississippiensis TaxID=8496 RepID=A0A151NY03_ALLMI|nr:hypothetical protein Y1Q_0002440 [Alligator mississippiensis]